MTDNMALWRSVETTPTTECKPITGKQYNGTSPKPYYLVRRATETFGPCGIGWGFEIVEEKLLDGAMLEPGFYERIHFARVRVWYEWEGKRGTVEHVGQTPFSGKRKSGGTYTDEDAPKKSVTDAMVKALSMIGFAGDIFSGRYDDSKYVAGLKEAERKAAEPPQFWEGKSLTLEAADTRDLYKKLLAHVRMAPTIAHVNRLMADNEAGMKVMPDEGREAIFAEMDKRRAFLSQAPNEKKAA